MGRTLSRRVAHRVGRVADHLAGAVPQGSEQGDTGPRGIDVFFERFGRFEVPVQADLSTPHCVLDVFATCTQLFSAERQRLGNACAIIAYRGHAILIARLTDPTVGKVHLKCGQRCVLLCHYMREGLLDLDHVILCRPQAAQQVVWGRRVQTLCHIAFARFMPGDRADHAAGGGADQTAFRTTCRQNADAAPDNRTYRCTAQR
mmetsp:Transcript_22546/g.36638  ORF Transcript_22546/g.36638 Transcript_22546/m.36638 type:complete len:203 (+) Transcript_22546:870-1478(+)